MTSRECQQQKLEEKLTLSWLSESIEENNLEVYADETNRTKFIRGKMDKQQRMLSLTW